MRDAEVRPPAVAGTFYPDRPDRLAADVDRYVREGRGAPGPKPRAIVAPHAGYLYSGPIAGSAFRALAPHAAAVRRVVLLGPSHFVAFSGLSLPRWSVFETPLGVVPVAPEGRAALADCAVVSTLDRPHAREHALEVELPFLQRTLDAFELVPIVVGEAPDEDVAAVIERLWDDATLVVVSTDLSHYLDFERARARDERTAEAIEALDAGAVAADDACGSRPLRGLLVAARRRGLTARRLDLRNSGETAGPRDAVVGYGAFALA